MKIIRSEEPVAGIERSVLSVGNFDGIHKGHQLLIDTVRKQARKLNAVSCIITFKPHTRSVIHPHYAQPLLTTFDEKACILRSYDIDYLICLPFTAHYAEMPPDRFVEEILIDRYKAIEWVMGENHKFGRNREGNNDFLHKRIGRNHFNMFTVSLHSDESAVASSTTIRGLIVESRIDEAVAMLGHPYLILAERIRGKQKGKSLGFPTLNFKVPPSQKVIPPPGVYAARIEVRGLNLEGALYYGNCPTFADRDFHFEFHSVDPVVQDPKLNTEVAVWLYRFIRPDEQFSSEQLLVNQIKNDIQTIRKFFKKE